MIRYLSKVNPKKLKGVALLRLDFNTEDDWRVEAALSTVRFLLARFSKIVIVSHKGRPRGFDKKLSLRSGALILQKLLGKKVFFIPHFRFGEIKKKIADSPRGTI
ncbi:MAG: phosphoglycerate kinase, partial [Patescibacteria group bacterium]